MVTARDSAEVLLAAFAAGADDFLAKPADTAQLLARIRSGERVLALERRLEERIAELEHTLDKVPKLKRLLPICMVCKKVRDDAEYGHEIDAYLHEHTGTEYSPAICPACAEKVEHGSSSHLLQPHGIAADVMPSGAEIERLGDAFPVHLECGDWG